jgi:hypothetical protein
MPALIAAWKERSNVNNSVAHCVVLQLSVRYLKNVGSECDVAK